MNNQQQNNSNVIEVDSVVTRFGSNTVHNGVSFAVQPGKIVALIGGSGSGKSVLLREILGLQQPTAGTINLFGENVWDSSVTVLDRLRARYGVLFQNGALFSALSVGENVAAPLNERMDLDPELVEKVVGLRLILSGLSLDTLTKMPSELSGGMRKRVALARALALEPELLFLDEPTSGLDPITARGFDRMIRTLCDDLGITVFMATHDLDTLVSIVDQIIVLADAKVAASGSYEEVSSAENAWIREYFSSRT